MSAKGDIAAVIHDSKEIILTTHQNPDGDAIGSLLACGLGLQAIGKTVTMAIAEPVPDIYRYLPGNEQIVPVAQLDRDFFDVAIFLDCTDASRAGDKMATLVDLCQCQVNIDHHVSNTGFGCLHLVDPQAAATGEIVLDLLKFMEVTITPALATNLYAALVTDTGSFQHQNTTPHCHRTAAELLEDGADHNGTYQKLFEEHSISSLRLLASCLSNLRVNGDGLIAWITVSQENIRTSGSSTEECEGLVDYPRSLGGVEVGILFKELGPGQVKVSLRSKNYVDVNKLAAFYGGGGHPRAAGCSISGNLEDVVVRVVQDTEKFIKGLRGNR
jgi:phosphoesterase RecJ-like protein